MSILFEIEAAAERLPMQQKESLIQFLTTQVQRERKASRPQNDLSEFSGVLRLAEDPLEWQRRMREEWV